MTVMTHVGKPVRRREDRALLTGQGQFVDDLSPPGTAYISFARSPYPKARIGHINTKFAEAAAGVLKVVTPADLEGMPDMPLNQPPSGMRVPPNPVLAHGTVNAVGMIVAGVVAKTRAEAEDAAHLLESEIEYAPLQGVADATDALNLEAPPAWDALGQNASFSASRRG